tara:strand:- start:384 stop:740 length:357 start_codon:yes stop_codon:yes gene_type:complete
MLKLLGGESDTVTVIREGHCLVGWIEWIRIDGDDDAKLAIANEAQKRLTEYPCLNEEDLSERETDAANDTWMYCYTDGERLEYIRENGSQFEFSDWADLRAVVRGEYFSGYASDLIGP